MYAVVGKRERVSDNFVGFEPSHIIFGGEYELVSLYYLARPVTLKSRK